MEPELPGYTHAYFPQEQFDEVRIAGRYAFGRKGDAYCALVGHADLHFREGTTDDLIQPGRQAFWIIEAGRRADEGSFDQFCQRILANPVSFSADGRTLRYASNGKQHELAFGQAWRVDGQELETAYLRFASAYAKHGNAQDGIRIEHAGQSLDLDFYRMKREYTQ